MPVDRYRTTRDLPASLPILPLRGAILLPRVRLPLNIFEPRYLAMVDDALAGNRLIGLVQPAGGDVSEESPTDKSHPLRQTGCVGRITAFVESDDGTVQITLTGISRFSIRSERETSKPYRICEITLALFADDLVQGLGEEDVDRPKLLQVLREYLETYGLSADWKSIHEASTEYLVNTLSLISPYGPEEKQALLEAPDLKSRAEILMALAEMDMAGGGDSGPSGVMQ